MSGQTPLDAATAAVVASAARLQEAVGAHNRAIAAENQALAEYHRLRRVAANHGRAIELAGHQLNLDQLKMQAEAKKAGVELGQ